MGRWLEGWLWDLRIGARGLARRPTMSLLVVGTLAIGIGANAAIHGALDRIVLRPLAFDGSERAVYAMAKDIESGFVFSATQPLYERWRQGARSFEAMEAFQPLRGLLVRETEVEQLDGAAVSIGLSSMIGAVPVVGRTFTPDDAEPGASPTMMLAERYWRSAFGGDPTLVGSTLTVDDVERIVVGIWPGAGRFRIDEEPLFFTPLEHGAEIDRASFSIILGLLAEGVDEETAGNELAALSAGLGDDAGLSSWRREEPVVLPVYSFVSGAFIQALWVLFAGVGLLLLVSAVNAANLLLYRAIDRERELGVRMALGGSRSRLLRHFFIEGRSWPSWAR